MPKRKHFDTTSLGTMSRSIVNRNVNIENIDSLPLPRSLKDECFVNVNIDRSKEFIQRQSSDPCNRGCCNFPMSGYFKQCHLVREKPLWSEEIKSTYGINLFYSATSPELPSDAEWLKMPDRETLLKSYHASSFGKQILEACLNPLRFDSSTGLGQVHEWIHRYLYFHDNGHGWYHLSIRAGCFTTFLKLMKNVSFVVLPYGCISELVANGIKCSEKDCLKRHIREMIIVVKNDDYAYKQALKRLDNEAGPNYGGSKNFYNKKIRKMKQFIHTIAYVSKPQSRTSYRYYIIFNPIIYHAVWWMLLLVPKGCLNEFAKLKVAEKTFDMESYRKKYCASLELGIENCVVQFDPLYQCIGDDVRDLKKHIEENKPFIYWLRGRILNVTEIKDVPAFITRSDDPKNKFINWCVSRGMNTLLNLNGDSWVLYKEFKSEETLEEVDWLGSEDEYFLDVL